MAGNQKGQLPIIQATGAHQGALAWNRPIRGTKSMLDMSNANVQKALRCPNVYA